MAVKKESETQAIKRVLKEQGYEVVSCKYGRGTASWWIETVVIYPDDAPPMTRPVERYPGQIDQMYTTAYSEFRGKVAWEAQKAAGRDHLEDDIQTDLFMVCMNTSVISRKEHEENQARRKRYKDELTEGKTCKECRTLGVYQQRKVRYRNVYKCPKCGKEWLY